MWKLKKVHLLGTQQQAHLKSTVCFNLRTVTNLWMFLSLSFLSFSNSGNRKHRSSLWGMYVGNYNLKDKTFSTSQGAALFRSRAGRCPLAARQRWLRVQSKELSFSVATCLLPISPLSSAVCMSLFKVFSVKHICKATSFHNNPHPNEPSSLNSR